MGEYAAWLSPMTRDAASGVAVGGAALARRARSASCLSSRSSPCSMASSRPTDPEPPNLDAILSP